MEVAEFVFKVIAGVLAALWAFWTWRVEHQKDRKQRAALYLNPYIFACEELQSRIWNVLEHNGISVLRGDPKYPDLSYAEETLYLIAQYFGWQHCIYRYYLQDAEMIQCTLRIRNTFATDHYGTGAFCFFRREQWFLGQTIMQRITGELGGEFDVIAIEDFRQKLNSPDFSKRSSIQETLAALRKAEKATDFDLDVRKRLAMIQNELVKLLSLIEKQEGVSVFVGKRTTAKIPK